MSSLKHTCSCGGTWRVTKRAAAGRRRARRRRRGGRARGARRVGGIRVIDQENLDLWVILSSSFLVMRRISKRVSSERLEQSTWWMISISSVWLVPFFPMPIFDTVSQILNLNSSISFSSSCDLEISVLQSLVMRSVSCSQLLFSCSNRSANSFCSRSSATLSSRSSTSEFSWQLRTLSSMVRRSLLRMSLRRALSSLMYLLQSLRGSTLWILWRKSLQLQLTQSTLRSVRQQSVSTLLCCTQRSWLLLLCIRLNRLMHAHSFSFLNPSSPSFPYSYRAKSSPFPDYCMYRFFSPLCRGDDSFSRRGDFPPSSFPFPFSWLTAIFLADLRLLEFCIVIGIMCIMKRWLAGLWLVGCAEGLTTSCRYISDLDEQQIWNFFSFSPFEVYFTFTLGSLSVLLLLLALASWARSGRLVAPSDIMVVIAGAALLDNLALYCEVVYFRASGGEGVPGGFGRACSALGFFSMLGNAVSLYYNTFFCVSLAYSINNTLRKPFLDNFKMHCLCLCATLSAVLIIIFTQNSGAPLAGLCVYRLASQSSLGLFFLHVLLLSVCLYSMRKFRARIPKNSYFERKSHFKYFNSYILFFACCEATNTLLYLIGNIACQTRSDALGQLIDDLYGAANVIAVLQGLGIALLRLSHPRVVEGARRLVGRGRGEEVEEVEWMDSLVESIKGSEILSFIEAIMMNYIEHASKYPQALTPYHFQKEYSFLIDELIAEDYVRRRITNRDSHFNRQNSAGLKTLKFEVVIFTPEYYSWLFRSEKVNLFASFDVRRNLSLVKQESYTEGGRSGEFFFATYDHQFIFKTIKAEEAGVCSQKAQQFYDYFRAHPDTLLTKILGLYSFTRRDILDQPIFLILMKNLTLTPKHLNLRVYDIKGSEFNRSTLKDRRIAPHDEQQLRKYTLKDKDFLAIEGRVDIAQPQADALRETLVRDIQFLAGLGVMDYSLLIIKREGGATGQAGEYPSVRQPGVYFNLGVIDYLEEWTLRRKAERVFKTLITSEEVTANSPANYAHRLIEFIHTIL